MLALTREVPESVTRALRAQTRDGSSDRRSRLATAPDPPIDPRVARAQHAIYRRSLAALGLEVIVLPGDDACPDCQFIEDTAVVAAGLALITRPGAASRQLETPPVAAALAARMEVVRVPAPATVDGGDCLRLGRTIYVGRSARTNAAGIFHLAAAFAPRGIAVVAVDLPPHVLHLKCVCAPLGDGRMTLADDTIASDVFAGAEIVRVPAEEAYAANCVAYGGGVLVSDGYPRTQDALEAAGFRVIAVPTTEAHKADGALTCMSILVDESR